MELHVTHEEGLVIARTLGAIDASARAPLSDQLHPLVSEAGTKVVLDLSASNFISSEGIGQLVALVARANSSGSRVILAAPSSFVAIVLNRCKLDQFFEICGSATEAVHRLTA